ncbi:MAG: agmatine deiminase family protein [Saprospirales bacterium]|nr:agmatine deiminase family protein [Saprospirales bacterium]
MKFFTPLLFFLLPLALTAQKDLPNGFDPQEWQFLQSGLYNFPEGIEGITTPPPYPVRAMAEWEEIQALCVTWTSYKGILAQIIQHAKEQCEVIVICNDSIQAKNQLLNTYGLPDLNNVSFLVAPYNTVWIRDYGPNCVYANDVDSLHLIDWIYNRPRPKDDVIPDKIGEYLDYPVFSTTEAPTDYVATGGNYLPDGMGTAFSSELIVEENGAGNPFGVTAKSLDDIDAIMNSFMGIENYIKMPVLPYDAIHHIDMHWYLLDEETIMAGLYPPGTADGPQIEANLQYVLSNFTSPFGTPYKVVRIQMPPDWGGDFPPFGEYRTYANSVFVNNIVLTPTYEEQYDTNNLKILRDALPGYEVIGIDCNDIIGASGALHCITKPIGVADPLLIQHKPLEDVYDYYDPFEVNASIQHRSGVSSAKLYYTTDTTQAYSPVDMTLTNATEHTWTGSIPGQSSDIEIFYYIEGVANSGKTLTRPMPAPAGYWNFHATFSTSASEEGFQSHQTLMDPIFPNPARAITCIPVQSERREEARIEMLDLLGRTVHVIHEGAIPAGESSYFIQALHFQPGSYLVRLSTGHGQQIQKLIIR